MGARDRDIGYTYCDRDAEETPQPRSSRFRPICETETRPPEQILSAVSSSAIATRLSGTGALTAILQN